MANLLYDAGREAFLDGNLDWAADTIKVTLLDTSNYVYSSAHDFFNDITVGGQTATSGAFVGKTTTAGTADASDVTLSAVSGGVSENLIIWEDDASASDSDRLIARIDTATGLAVNPNGGDITIQWDSGTDRIFTL